MIVDTINFDQEWERKGFHGVLHIFYACSEFPVKNLMKYYGDAFSTTLFFVSNDYINWYWNSADMRRLRNSLIKKVSEDPKFLDRLLDDWHARLRIFDAVMDQVESTDLSKASDEELLDLYMKFYKAYCEEYALAVPLQDSFSMHADEFLTPAIKEFLEKKGLEDYFTEYSSILTAPVNESFVTQRKKHLMKMLVLYKKSSEDPELQKMLEEHAKNFFWVQNNYANIVILDKDFFLKELETLSKEEIDPEKELEKLESQIPNTKTMKKKLIADLELPKDLQDLVKITEVFTYMQDERKKYVLISNHYQKLFLDEIAKRTGLSYEELAYTCIYELSDILINREVDREKLKSRKKLCMSVHTLEGYQILDGEEAEKIFKEHFTVESDNIREIKGMTASKGKAKGIVKIVKKTHDLINVEKGDILVADMTRPEMTVAMEKAGAIVTDEGGITSHAAIVSRELGTPCIVGTKIATHVLKDGDLVEVDADNGVVKVIS